MLETTEVAVDGVKCRVRQAGNTASSEAVVFLHGNPGPSDDWEFVAPDVGALTRAVLIDMPGFGLSDRPRDFDYTVEGYAAYLDAVLERLGVRDVHLVMHDFGAGWGLSWAGQHRDRVRSITLINCGILENYRWHKYARIWRTPVLGELFQLLASANLMHASLNKSNPRPVPREFVDRVFRYADWGHKRAVLKLYRNTRSPSRLVRRMLAPAETLPVPALVLWGDGDTFLPVAHAEQQKKYFPEAEVYVLRDCGHWPFVDDPDGVRGLLVPFLEKHLAETTAARPPRATSSD